MPQASVRRVLEAKLDNSALPLRTELVGSGRHFRRSLNHGSAVRLNLAGKQTYYMLA